MLPKKKEKKTKKIFSELLHFNNFIPFKFTFSKNYVKLNGDLHPILGSLSQFLSTNINFSKFLIYK